MFFRLHEKLRINVLRFSAGVALALGWQAQSPAGDAPGGLELGQARAEALAHNQDLRVAELAVDAALGQLKSAKEYPNPTLSLSTAKISTDGTPASTPWGNSLLNRSYDSIVSLSQLLPVAKRGLERDAATASYHSAQFQRQDAQRLLYMAVTQAYAAALAAGEQAKVLGQSAAKLRQEATIAANRYHAGDLSASDQAQLEIAAEQEEIGAQAQLASARTAVITLEILMGRQDPRGDTPLADSLQSWYGSLSKDLLAAPVGQRPDILAAEAALRSADASLTLQRRQRIPDVTASVQFERNPPSQPDTVGIGLSLPLPLWDHFTGEILTAKAARDQAQAALDKARARAASDVSSARVAYQEASQRAERYTHSLLPKSAQVEKSVAYAFERGSASLLDLLEAERSDNLVRVGALQAQADAASAASALEAALGRTEGLFSSETKSTP